MKTSKYHCSECRGWRVVECCSCGSEVDCEACNATGLDSEEMDVEAFQKASAELMSSGMSWELREDGEPVGREGADGRKAYYRDFARANVIAPEE